MPGIVSNYDEREDGNSFSTENARYTFANTPGSRTNA
jgi:hypothetical protein